MEGLLPGLAGGAWQVGKAINSITVQFPFTSHHNDFAAKVRFQWCVFAGIALFSAMKNTAASFIFQVLEQNLSPGRHYIYIISNVLEEIGGGGRGQEWVTKKKKTTKKFKFGNFIVLIQTITQSVVKLYFNDFLKPWISKVCKGMFKIQKRKNISSTKKKLQGFLHIILLGGGSITAHPF